jgi:hypothetical protein
MKDAILHIDGYKVTIKEDGEIIIKEKPGEDLPLQEKRKISIKAFDYWMNEFEPL